MVFECSLCHKLAGIDDWEVGGLDQLIDDWDDDERELAEAYASQGIAYEPRPRPEDIEDYLYCPHCRQWNPPIREPKRQATLFATGGGS